MHFTYIFLFAVTSKSSIDINAISIFNNQQSMNHKDNFLYCELSLQFISKIFTELHI